MRVLLSLIVMMFVIGCSENSLSVDSVQEKKANQGGIQESIDSLREGYDVSVSSIYNLIKTTGEIPDTISDELIKARNREFFGDSSHWVIDTSSEFQVSDTFNLRDHWAYKAAIEYQGVDTFYTLLVVITENEDKDTIINTFPEKFVFVLNNNCFLFQSPVDIIGNPGEVTAGSIKRRYENEFFRIKIDKLPVPDSTLMGFEYELGDSLSAIERLDAMYKSPLKLEELIELWNSLKKNFP